MVHENQETLIYETLKTVSEVVFGKARLTALKREETKAARGSGKLERYAAAFLAGIKKHLDEHPEISNTNTSSLAPGPMEVKRRQDVRFLRQIAPLL